MGRFSKITTSAEKPKVIPGTSEGYTESYLPLDEILQREEDTRPLNEVHVKALAESIAAVGLIQPIAVDKVGRLLAGGHRKAAIVYLQTNDKAVFDKWFNAGIPIYRFDFDASENKELALAIEASENEKRRDYTPAEVRELADRLKAVGYNFTSGRPKKGQKSLIPSLSVIVGKSDKTIRRYLSSDTRKVDNRKSGHMTGFSAVVSSTAKSLQRLIAEEDTPDDIKQAAVHLLQKIQKELIE
ncbi:ParB/RepB/Spo0J family partition protein [filamentous cyanobacterium LEGE 11480]|uniref:ParB/RepB/Spo0J family partition protein n=1 Tax=Romeriopsis navalis LEGE 11480 TaxID=2777977 RepID=A0A928VPZ6_9CYAN|nr:ParB/RepB/Spo0J family partition protein [Romeriopsis navalis]MBE9030475.1 ParB/RepB/Spo0J family partition protein [Romeriopsis navalis LEGE 11480]